MIYEHAIAPQKHDDTLLAYIQTYSLLMQSILAKTATISSSICIERKIIKSKIYSLDVTCQIPLSEKIFAA
ncbi:hypothetical protein JL09_g5362 [Pichia kudriavzevii]|uniref:Uncharacterized protein n=1 Tax=Pichia kudriavzevii TaxID=4909 RepID=A0A099NRU3_PICKU|nr:hypothetical protein JL09_g5362 [Pichia kudriavzevii]